MLKKTLNFFRFGTYIDLCYHSRLFFHFLKNKTGVGLKLENTRTGAPLLKDCATSADKPRYFHLTSHKKIRSKFESLPRKDLQSLSASRRVIMPHRREDTGMAPARLRISSWTGVHCTQVIPGTLNPW